MSQEQRIKEYVEQANWEEPEKMNTLFRKLRDDYYQDASLPYKAIFDQIEDLNPVLAEKYFKKGKQRRDDRSLGTFAMDIYDGHVKERTIKDAWMAKWGKDYLGGQEFTPSGIDSSGALILKCDVATPDYQLTEPHPVFGCFMEMKSNVCDWKFTYKTVNLNEYRQRRSSVLTVFLTNSGEWKMFCLFTPDEINRLASKIESIDIRFEVGSKPAIQLHWGMDDVEIKNKRLRNALSPKSLPLEEYCGIIKRI